MRITSAIILGSFCFSAFAPILTIAQAWRPAVLVLAGGDSLRGEVEFSDPDLSTREVSFRTSAGSAEVPYNTDQVNSFRISNPTQTFEKLEARINYYSKGVVKWGDNPIIDTKSIVVFAEVMRSTSSIRLYSVFDENREERLFIRKNEELTELINISYLVERDANTLRVKEERYQSQLKTIFVGCPAAQKQSFSYDGRSIGRAIDKYVACKGESTTGSGTQKQRYEHLYFGLFGFMASGSGDGISLPWTGTVGGSLQVLSRKNRGNQFLWLNIGGPISQDLSGLPFFVGAFAGTYIGSAKVQPLVDVGVTSIDGTIILGAGVAYNKRILLVGNFSRGGGAQIYTVGLTVFPRLGPKPQ